MSSLRNAVKRVAHKERAQPSARRGKGLLEKHGDYIERARDFQKKRKRIDRLREKAREKNPDEFYQAMVGKRTRDGIHVDESNHGEKLTNEEVRRVRPFFRDRAVSAPPPPLPPTGVPPSRGP